MDLQTTEYLGTGLWGSERRIGPLYLVDDVCDAVLEDQIRLHDAGVVDKVLAAPDADLEGVAGQRSQGSAVDQVGQVADEAGDCMVGNQLRRLGDNGGSVVGVGLGAKEGGVVGRNTVTPVVFSTTAVRLLVMRMLAKAVTPTAAAVEDRLSGTVK